MNSDKQTQYALDSDIYPGALVTLEDGPEAPEVDSYEPSGEELASIRQAYEIEECRQEYRNTAGSYELKLCEDPDAPENPTAKVVIAPDSHAGHWEQAFRRLGNENNWEVILAIKSGCNFSGIPGQPGDDYCHQWNDNFMEWLETQEIDLLVAPGTRMYERPATESIAEGAVDRWRQIEQTGTPLLLLRGIVRPGPDNVTADCLAADNRVDECGAIAGDAYGPNPLKQADLADTTHTIDMNPHICPRVKESPQALCSAVVGNVAVWYDKSHITPQYSLTLAPILKDEIEKLYPEIFPR